MTGLGDIYTRGVHTNLAPLYANWEPTKPVRAGDYGTVSDKNNQFTYHGNIKEFGVPFSLRTEHGASQRTFFSEGSGSLTFHAKGEASPGVPIAANATLEIQFSKENAVFFNAAGCRYQMVSDKEALGRMILQKYLVERS